MGKRANTGAATAAKKAKANTSTEPKVDPAFASVVDALMESEQIPQRTQAMLVEMLPFSLKFASDERHDLQNMAVDMVEQTLTAKKNALDAHAAAEAQAVTTLKGSESQLGTNVTDAEAALKAKTEHAAETASALEKAVEAEKVSEDHLRALKEEDEAAAGKVEAMKEEKEAINAAFAEHFAPIQEGSASKHFKKLEPFLKKIEIESTLLTALPSTCAKAKEKRGAFDNIVVEELGKAFNKKVDTLTAAIDGAVPAAEQRAAALSSAEQDRDAKKAAREQAATESQQASEEKTSRAAALKEAEKAIEDFHPKVEEVTGRLTAAQTALSDFEDGPLSNFTRFKNRIAAVPEEPAPEAAPEAAEETAPAAAEAPAEQES